LLQAYGRTGVMAYSRTVVESYGRTMVEAYGRTVVLVAGRRYPFWKNLGVGAERGRLACALWRVRSVRLLGYYWAK
jgi:limonene-1,2-epoxide hydrolase